MAQATILTRCGPEIGVASTKAFTGQLLALHLLSLRLGIARRVMDETELRRRLHVLRSLRSPMESLIGGAARDEMARIAEKATRTSRSTSSSAGERTTRSRSRGRSSSRRSATCTPRAIPPAR